MIAAVNPTIEKLFRGPKLIANLTQKTSFFVEHFFPDHAKKVEYPKIISSCYKKFPAPFLVVDHSIKLSRECWALKGKKVDSFGQLCFGNDATKYKLDGDKFNADPSIQSVFFRFSQLAQKVCDAGSIAGYAGIISKENGRKIQDWKSTFQMIQYSIEMVWDGYKLFTTDFTKNPNQAAKKTYRLTIHVIKFIGSTFACICSTASAIDYHYIKDPGQKKRFKSAVCIMAEIAAIAPIVNTYFMEVEKIYAAPAA